MSKVPEPTNPAIAMESEKSPAAPISTETSVNKNRVLDEADIAENRAAEKRLLRKIDWNVLPLLIVSYMLQFLDKTSLGNTAVLGIIHDTKLVGQEFSWLNSVFYIGYLVASYPASLAMVKFPIGKVLAASIVAWAVVLGCHAAGQNFAGLTVLRILLGAFESAISPGFSLLTGIWYKPSEHASRHGIWFAGNAIGGFFGGLMAYGVANISGGIAPWRWLFIILGAVTLLWGLVLAVFLPDAPLTARFLNAEERRMADERPQKEQQSFKTSEWSYTQFIEALKDPKTWLFSLIIGVASLTNGVVSNFGSLIISSFGYDRFQTLLLGLPTAGVQLVSVLTASFLASRIRKSRLLLCVFLWVVAIMGILLVQRLPASNKIGRLVGNWLMVAFSAAFPLLLSLMASNVAGFTKKATVQATFFVFYCVGNIGGPQLFISKEAPNYNTAYNGCIGCLCVTIVLAVVLRQYMDWENKRRDKAQGVYIDPEPKDTDEISVEEIMHDRVTQTDWENKKFRYYL